MRDAYLRFFEEASREDPQPESLSFPNADGWDFVLIGGVHIIYRRPETAAALKRLRDCFFTKPWSNKWSNDFIQGVLAEAFVAASQSRPPDSEVVREAMESAALKLDGDASLHRVIFAVGGVYVPEEISFGKGVRLFQMTEEENERLKQTFERIVLETLDSDDVKDRGRAEFDKALQTLHNWTCAEVVAAGDQEKAKEDADAIAEPMIDLLQLIAAVRGESTVTIRPGIVPTPRPPTLIFESTGEAATFKYSFRHAHGMALTHDDLESLRSRGWEALFAAVSTPADRRSEFQSLLLRSLHWIADAERQERGENRITSYMTALEMFFSTGGGPIRRDVSEGAAYILTHDVREREAIAKVLGDLYGQRSDVSHSGSRDVGAKDVRQLKALAIKCLARFSQMAWRFKKPSDVQTWIGELRLSGRYSDKEKSRDLWVDVTR